MMKILTSAVTQEVLSLLIILCNKAINPDVAHDESDLLYCGKNEFNIPKKFNRGPVFNTTLVVGSCFT